MEYVLQKRSVKELKSVAEIKSTTFQTGLGPLPYEYKYEVSDRGAKSGPLQFKKQEKADSSGSITGQYSVLLPDGRTQVRDSSEEEKV